MESNLARWAVFASLTVSAVGSLAQEEDRGTATLRVCNKGARVVSVMSALEDPDALIEYGLDVRGWWTISPGRCQVVVEQWGYGGRSGESTAPAYVGFAFFDGDSPGAAARVDQVPDFGSWHNNWVQAVVTGVGSGPVLSRANKTICVRRAAMAHRVTTKSEGCSTIRADGDGGPFFPLAAAFRFEPVPSWFAYSTYGTSAVVGGEWVGGDYHLDVAPRPNDLGLYASVGSADFAGTDAGGDANDHSEWTSQIAIAMAEAKQRAAAEKSAEEAARAEANRKAIEARSTDPVWIRHEDELRAKWSAPSARARDFGPHWLGKQMHVGGTVADVSVESGQPAWLTLRFRDSSFVVCSPSPAIFTGLFGDDLSALVGQQIEVVGEIESPRCDGGPGSIRVLDSDSVRRVDPAQVPAGSVTQVSPEPVTPEPSAVEVREQQRQAELTAWAATRTPEQIQQDKENRYACDEEARIATGADRDAWRRLYCTCVKARVTDQRDWCKGF